MDNLKIFALGKPDGISSSLWRFWTRKGDIYIGVNSIYGNIKTSLHASGTCQTSFSKSFFERIKDVLKNRRPRHISKWQGKEIAEGLWRLLDIVIPHENLKRVQSDNKTIGEIDWIEPLSEFKNTQFTIFRSDNYLGEDKWVGKNAMKTKLYHKCILKDGKHVYIVYFGQNEYSNKTTVAIPDEYKKDEYAAMRLPISPDIEIGYLVDSFRI